MSGPKRSDVKAALDIARQSAESCAHTIARTEESVIESLLNEARRSMHEANAAAHRAGQVNGRMNANERRAAGNDLAAAEQAARNAQNSIGNATAELNSAMTELESIRSAAETARGIMRNAEQEFGSAMNLYNQDTNRRAAIDQANRARRAFEEAEQKMNAANRRLASAQKRANSALRQARDGANIARSAEQQGESARRAGQARLRAEEEAKRITEQQRREATLAISNAHTAAADVESLNHGKFFPGEYSRASGMLNQAQRLLDSGQNEQAKTQAVQGQAALAELARRTRDAQAEYDRRKSDAETQLDELTTAIGSIDADLVCQWSGTPLAVEQANTALTEARRAIETEDFEKGSRLAEEAANNLLQAFRCAAENRGANERRNATGQVIMNVLQEMGFEEVTCQPGALGASLLINGQTPDVNGIGDFDISIPLNGEVDFQINHPEGDVSCIAAVQGLQERLRARGISWETTDWGHASGAAVRSGARVGVQEQQREQVREKG